MIDPASIVLRLGEARLDEEPGFLLLGRPYRAEELVDLEL